MERLEKLSKQVLGSFTDESHVRRSLEGRRYVTPFLLEQLIHSAGEENVFTSELELEKHSLDHSHHLASAPEVVIYARSTEMISEVMKVCWRYRIPVTPCGARTGLEGGAIPFGGVSLDMSKMNQVLHVYREELQVHVQAGVRKEALNEHLEPMGLFFQVDPASNPSLGGMSATGASGTLCCNYGTMKENVVSLTVVLADGTIVRPTRRRTRKNSTGYDLTHLCMGQEGTLCVVSELLVKVTPRPKAESSLQVSFERLEDCSRSVVEMRQAGIPLARCELLNRISIESLNAVEGRKENGKTMEAVPTLFLQVHAASSAAAESALTEAEAICAGFGAKSTVLAVGKEEQERLWDLRRSAYYACRANRHHMLQRKAQDIRMLSTDVCVPLSHFCLLIEETEKDYAATAPERFLCNIFGHAADGNFHCVVLYDHADPKDLELLHQLDQRMWARCLALGGTVSGEHGCGMGKVPALQEEWGQEAIDLMWRLKRSMDEREILNPGKLLPSRS
ncbi:Probable D-lactate dehydrogenase [Durusdinium trenchii]|uniref:D-lactate dehydrogenase (cytochrome) n=1 Tax=Durusdinium trenchii TaxID=1381693 RepID=A0ABP0IC58_9DINO